MSNACIPILFADDAIHYRKSIGEMYTKMTKELEKVQCWLNCNKLSINVSRLILWPLEIEINVSMMLI